MLSFSLSLGQPGKGLGKHKLEIWKAPGDRETEEDEKPIAVIERPTRYVSSHMFLHSECLHL